MNRIAIFTFYDKDGIADRYIDYFLNDLCKNIQRLVLVANIKLSPQAHILFEKFTNEILIRENKGLDIEATKDAIDYIGWDMLCKYDELVICSDTVFGPIYPFVEMFAEMEKKDLDFWGITKHYGVDDPTGISPYRYIPEHIQNYFIVYRKRMLCNKDLKEFYNNIPILETYSQAAFGCESVITKKFADKGYSWGVYCDTGKNSLSHNMMMYCPLDMLTAYRAPVINRNVFSFDPESYLMLTTGETAQTVMRHLKEHTNYDTDMILEHIIRTCNVANILQAMNFIYVLPDKHTIYQRVKGQKTALLMHLYYMDLLPLSVLYATAVPESTDIYIATPQEENFAHIKEAFASLPNRVEVRVTQNRGRDVGSLVVGLRDIPERYDVCCFFHDKKSSHLTAPSIGASFFYKSAHNILASRQYVQNILGVFNENPLLGLLCPSPPSHSVYRNTLGSEWGQNFELVDHFSKRMKLNTPLDKDVFPPAPLGSYFWFRSKAMKKLFDLMLTYDELPPEPVALDGTILHAIERVHPYVAQDAGYYTAFVYTDSFAAIECINLMHYSRESLKEYAKMKFAAENHDDAFLDTKVSAKRVLFLRVMRIIMGRRRFKKWLKIKADDYIEE